MVPISPVRSLTSADRRSEADTYRAIALTEDRPLYIHLSGVSWTRDKNYAWSGSRPQFLNLQKHNPQTCDGFSLVSLPELTGGKTYGSLIDRIEDL